MYESDPLDPAHTGPATALIPYPDSHSDSPREPRIEWEFEFDQDASGPDVIFPPFVDLSMQTSVVLQVAWECFLEAGNASQYFNHLGRIIVLDPLAEAGYTVVDKDNLRFRLITMIDWFRNGKPTTPSKDLVGLLHEFFLTRLPRVESMTALPVFTRDRVLLDEPGYHPDYSLLYLSHKLPLLAPVASIPTTAEVADSVRFLQEEVLGEFRFATEADRAHALGMLLTPFVRSLLGDALVPAHLVLANTPGAGKSTLCNITSIVATGEEAHAMAPGYSDEEMRKRITAALKTGRKVVLMDNLPAGRPLNSAALATLLTSFVWTDRVIGSSNTAEVKNDLLFMMTGNHPSLSPELLRRSVPIQLIGKVNWLENAYQNPEIVSWCREHRDRIVHACLTLIQSWIQSGQPGFSGETLHSYDAWCRTIGGILEHAGVPGFMEGLESFYGESNARDAELEDFFKAWWKTHGGKPVRCKDLVELCGKKHLQEELGGGTDRSKQNHLSQFLKARQGEFDGTWIMEVIEKKPSNAYRLTRKAEAGETDFRSADQQTRSDEAAA